MSARSETRPLTGADLGLLALNAIGAAAAACFAAAGLVRPDYVETRTTTTTASPLTRFWAASSTVRTWAITAPLLAEIKRGGRPAPQLLAVAGLVQLGDAALGVWQRNARMAVLPAAMGLVHLGSARLLTCHRTPKGGHSVASRSPSGSVAPP